MLPFMIMSETMNDKTGGEISLVGSVVEIKYTVKGVALAIQYPTGKRKAGTTAEQPEGDTNPAKKTTKGKGEEN